MATGVAESRPNPPKAILNSLQRWYESAIAEQWLINGVNEAQAEFTDCEELQGLGADYEGRWVDWSGVRTHSVRTIRKDATKALARIEVRSDWRAIHDGARRLSAEHLRAVPLEDGTSWPANVHIHARLDENGQVRWPTLKGFEEGTDPAAPTEAGVELEINEDTTRAIVWLAQAAARTQPGQTLDTAQERLRADWEHLNLNHQAAGILEGADELRLADLWLKGEEPEQGWRAPRATQLQGFGIGPTGRTVQWNGRQITTAAELPDRNAAIGVAMFRWPWTGPSDTTPRSLEAAEEIRVEIRDDVRVRGHLKQGEVTAAWIETGEPRTEPAGDRAPGKQGVSLALWIARRMLEAARKKPTVA